MVCSFKTLNIKIPITKRNWNFFPDPEHMPHDVITNELHKPLEIKKKSQILDFTCGLCTALVLVLANIS